MVFGNRKLCCSEIMSDFIRHTASDMSGKLFYTVSGLDVSHRNHGGSTYTWRGHEGHVTMMRIREQRKTDWLSVISWRHHHWCKSLDLVLIRKDVCFWSRICFPCFFSHSLVFSSLCINSQNYAMRKGQKLRTQTNIKGKYNVCKVFLLSGKLPPKGMETHQRIFTSSSETKTP